MAASTKEAGALLNAFPSWSLSLCMDDDMVRITVGLHLGSLLCRPHTCCSCGKKIDQVGTHGVSCRWSEGQHYRHAAINDIIHRALSSAMIPSHLGPSGLYCSNGKRPNGVSVVPW